MYKISETNDGVTVFGIKDFLPEHIFECGQCFRWNKNNEGYYCGVANGRYAEIHYDNSILKIKGATAKDYYDFWYDYFDLGTDYEIIKENLSKIDIHMKKAVEFGHGIRILNQDPFETLISFIISANNNIPRIKRCIENLCKEYGELIRPDIYTFPEPISLEDACVDDISICTKAGYRCTYIKDAASLFNKVSFDRNHFKNMSLDEARKFIQQYKGVGPKVADCILLFTGSYQTAFPVDVWVKKVMSNLYGVDSFKQIDTFQKSYFGSLSGYAQQYLFYAIREGFLKV